MKLIAHSTPVIVKIDGVPCRVWKAVDDEGREHLMFVHRVCTPDDALTAADVELIRLPDPKVVPVVYPKGGD